MSEKIIVNEKFKMIYDESARMYRIQAIRDIGDKNTGWFVASGTYGGLISDAETLGIDDDSWVEGNAVAKNSKLSDGAVLKNNAYVENSTITGYCKIRDNAQVFSSSISGTVEILDDAIVENSTIEGNNIVIANNAHLTHNVSIIGNSISIKKKAYITNSVEIRRDNIIIDESPQGNMKMLLRMRYGMPSNGMYTCYKLVKSTENDGVFLSIIDKEVVYDINQDTVIKSDQVDEDDRVCARGVHASFSESDFTSFVENNADRILTCLVDVDDILAIDFSDRANPKFRAKKMRVIDSRVFPMEENPPELPSITINHNLSTVYLVVSMYNLSSNEIFRDFEIVPISRNSAILKLNIDPESDDVRNYAATILAPNVNNIPNARNPQCFVHEITGDGTEDQFVIYHDLNSRNLLITVFSGPGDEDRSILNRKNVSNYTVVFDGTDRVVVKFDAAPKNNETLTVLLVKPAIPTATSRVGIYSNNSLVNVSSNYITWLFWGSDVNREKNRIEIPHSMSTYNLFGSLYDITINKYHSGDFVFSRKDEETAEVELNFQYYDNHQYAFILFWSYISLE